MMGILVSYGLIKEVKMVFLGNGCSEICGENALQILVE